MPHARVRSIDTSAALAMPGVKAILTADDLPAPADTVTDLGQTIRANPKGERALTNEPLYQGEPILAVAAVDESPRPKRSRGSRSSASRCRSSSIRWSSLRPGGPNARVEGNVWVAAAPPRPGGRSRRRCRSRSRS